MNEIYVFHHSHDPWFIIAKKALGIGDQRLAGQYGSIQTEWFNYVTYWSQILIYCNIYDWMKTFLTHKKTHMIISCYTLYSKLFGSHQERRDKQCGEKGEHKQTDVMFS